MVDIGFGCRKFIKIDIGLDCSSHKKIDICLFYTRVKKVDIGLVCTWLKKIYICLASMGGEKLNINKISSHHLWLDSVYFLPLPTNVNLNYIFKFVNEAWKLTIKIYSTSRWEFIILVHWSKFYQMTVRGNLSLDWT